MPGECETLSVLADVPFRCIKVFFGEFTGMCFQCELKAFISLEVRGDVAWTGLRLAVSANEIETGRKLDTTQQVTLIWEKQGGTWRIMHEHLSGPVRM